MATRVRLFDLQPSGKCWPDEAYEEMLKYQGKLSIFGQFYIVENWAKTIVHLLEMLHSYKNIEKLRQ